MNYSDHKNESLFDPICNEFALQFDQAAEDHDIEKTKSLLDDAEGILKDHDEPSFAPLFYSTGTSLTVVRDHLIHSGCTCLHDQVIKLNGEALWCYRHAEDFLKQIEVNEISKPYLDGLRLELYVNIGNAYHFCSREFTAMDYYTKALDIYPGFGMALGNIGRSLSHYAELDGDSGHQKVLFKKAYRFFRAALSDKNPMTYPEAKEDFATECKEFESAFGIEMLNQPIEYADDEMDQSDEEKSYRQWCLENHLFLNTLNDLPKPNSACAHDPLQIKSIMTSSGQKEPPFVFEMFNQIKEEYVYSRYQLYEVWNSNFTVCFADKETHLNDTMKYSDYSIRLEKLKTAFRTVYSLLDRIAYLLNAYFDLGINQGHVSFDKIWECLGQYEKRNAGLYALHWINRDFKEKYGKADSAYTKYIKDLRNALEHKFTAVHSDDIEDVIHKP